MTLRLEREQISVTYNDGRGRPTRSSQKLDNHVKTAIEDQAEAQDQTNLDLAAASAAASAASSQALAASSAAAAAASAASSASSLATTASGQALTASSQALSASSAASSASSAAASAASTASSAASAAASAASTASSAATTASSAATTASAAATAASAAQSSANTALAYNATHGYATAGVAGFTTGSPSGGLLSIVHGYTDPGGYPAALQYCTVTPYGAAAFFVALYSISSSTLVVYLADSTGTAISGGSYTVAWRVAGA